jgi:uncharacterized protein RhaS with RHS repeats
VLQGHRYYDPGQGRFLNRDPISYVGGINLYAYVTNSPLNLMDPSGLSPDKLPKTNLKIDPAQRQRMLDDMEKLKDQGLGNAERRKAYNALKAKLKSDGKDRGTIGSRHSDHHEPKRENQPEQPEQPKQPEPPAGPAQDTCSVDEAGNVLPEQGPTLIPPAPIEDPDPVVEPEPIVSPEPIIEWF